MFGTNMVGLLPFGDTNILFMWEKYHKMAFFYNLLIKQILVEWWQLIYVSRMEENYKHGAGANHTSSNRISSPGMFTFRTNQRPPTGLTPWMNTAHPFRQECVLRRHAPANKRAKSVPVTNQMREGAGTFNRKRCWIGTLRVLEPVSLVIVQNQV